MRKTPLALIALGIFASTAPTLLASTPGGKSSKLTVSVRVVSSCGVRIESSGTADVRCTRGAIDRVLVNESRQPRLVTLERDATNMTAQVQPDLAGPTLSERMLTLQF
jgi:hypothetical protein